MTKRGLGPLKRGPKLAEGNAEGWVRKSNAL